MRLIRVADAPVIMSAVREFGERFTTWCSPLGTYWRARRTGKPLDAQPRTAQSLKRLLHAAPTVLVHPAADASLIPLR